MKAFADDKLNVTRNVKVVFHRIENIVGKEENAGYQHFLLFPRCFQKAFLPPVLQKSSLCGKGLSFVKYFLFLIQKPGPGEHALQYNYGFWFSRKSQGNKSASYDQNLKLIGTFASVEQFWHHYSHIVRPSDLTGHTDYHLFKEGIRPMWEVRTVTCIL